jgi:hypothetical protein
MESFFSSLKTERTNRKHDLTRNAARADVFDYLERSTIHCGGTPHWVTSAPLTSSGLVARVDTVAVNLTSSVTPAPSNPFSLAAI